MAPVTARGLHHWFGLTCFHYIPEPVLLGDVAVVAVHGELLGVEDVLVAKVAEELLVVLVERARVQRHPAVEALDAPSVERSAVGRHHLRERKNIELASAKCSEFGRRWMINPERLTCSA